MSLARVKLWNPGDVLTASDLNTEFNNILNNPVSLISPTTGAINFALQAHTGIIPAAVTATSATAGQVLTASTAATPVAVWSNSAAGAGSRVMGLNGAISSQGGTFTANQYILQTTAGANSFVLNSTASFSVSIGTAGPAANGRDVAAAFASTYIHWYAITTGVGSTTLAGIVSSQAPPTGPVMPTNYSAWAYLGGSVYSSVSTTVSKDHFFRGNRAYYSTQITEVSAGNSTAETAVSLSGSIPNNALDHEHTIHSLLLPGTGQTLTVRATSGSDFWVSSTTASALSALVEHRFTLPRMASNQWYWLLSSQLASANDGIAAFLISYKMPNGDA